MEYKINKELFWNKAATAGIALGGVSIAYMYLERLILHIPAFIGGPLIFILGMVKFVGCILIMRYFMKSYVQADPAAEKRHAFRSGALSAVLSALLFAGVSMADVAFISPDFYKQQAQLSTELMKEATENGILDEMPFMKKNKALLMESTEQMANMAQSSKLLSVNTFHARFFSCGLYGILLALILSGGVVPNDPFRNDTFAKANDEEKPEDQSSNQ